MNLLVRAIVTGFGMAAGAALYKRFAKQLGLEEDKKGEEKVPEEVAEDGGLDAESSKLAS
jgi:hypothetical protein